MLDRRLFLRGGLGLAFAGLATGLRPAWLRDGLPVELARAESGSRASPVIFATSRDGDPINSTLPGGFFDRAVHVDDPAFLPTEVRFGGRAYGAAGIWRAVPAAFRERMAIVHHRTGAVAHSEYDSVMFVKGAVKGAEGNGAEMLPSALSAELAAHLGSVQSTPVCLGEERFTVGGVPLSPIPPRALADLFAGSEGVLGTLQDLRDAEVDRIYADLKQHGTRAQRTVLDRYVRSRNQARDIGGELGELLADLWPVHAEIHAVEYEEVLGPLDQVAAAVALAILNVAPVISIHIPFGGDNHQDRGLEQERIGALAGVHVLRQLWRRLEDHAMTESVTFAMYNTFGRTLRSRSGRQHNEEHNVMLISGPSVRGGVIGDVDASGRCTGFDPHTGAASDSAVRREDTAASAAATLMSAAGVENERVAIRVPDGRIATAALA